MLTNVHVPGAVWTSILAAMLYAAQDQISTLFPGAEWLPLVVAIIGFALKWLQVRSGIQPQVLPAPDETRSRSLQPAPPAPSKSALFVKFLLG